MKPDGAIDAPSRAQRQFVNMRPEHLDAVMAIERAAYAVPWTRGNFVDSLQSGCSALCLSDASSRVLGYMVSLQGVGEVHLLNLTVAPASQRQGHARHMLESLAKAAMASGAEQVWLEVRVGNQRALDLYQRFGFANVGLRKAYYPPLSGTGSRVREDAVTMSLPLRGSVR